MPPATPAPSAAPKKSGVAVSRLSIPMRDGVVLSAFRYHAEDGKKHPVILERTPYGKNGELQGFAMDGFDVVCEDVRGRGESQGEWRPMLHERKDGYDTIEWIARQDWCDGKVGMAGASYLGYVQWAAAAERPPHLACIVPRVSPPDPYQNLPYENGCFLLPVSLWYSQIVGKDSPADASASDPYRTWPVIDADVAARGVKNDIFRLWVKMENPEDWKDAETVQDGANAGIPSLSISGWADGDQIGTELRWRAGRLKDRWLIYGPWAHTMVARKQLGDRTIQLGDAPNLGEIEHAFLNRFLKGDEKALGDSPHVQAFILGADRWYRGDQWPPPSMAVRTFLDGNGELSKALGEGERSYVADPDHVRSTRPLEADPNNDTSPFWLEAEDLPYGSLVYHGAKLDQDQIVCGPFTANLVFRVDTPDVDLFAQPMDEAPDGRLLPLGQGGRARARKMLKLDRLQSGAEYTLEFPCWETLAKVPAGHRVSLMISSDRFPVYAVNSNSAAPMATATKRLKATVRISAKSSFTYSICDASVGR